VAALRVRWDLAATLILAYRLIGFGIARNLLMRLLGARECVRMIRRIKRCESRTADRF